jgi:hypothetical protein
MNCVNGHGNNGIAGLMIRSILCSSVNTNSIVPQSPAIATSHYTWFLSQRESGNPGCHTTKEYQ